MDCCCLYFIWLNKNPYKYLLKRPILVNRNVIHFSFPVEWTIYCTKHLVSMICVRYSRWYLFYVNISILKTYIACWLAGHNNCHTDKMNFYCFWSWLRNNHIFMGCHKIHCTLYIIVSLFSIIIIIFYLKLWCKSSSQKRCSKRKEHVTLTVSNIKFHFQNLISLSLTCGLRPNVQYSV